MRLYAGVPMRYLHERYFGRPSCPKCGKMMMAPELTEYSGDDDVLHTWICDGCDYRFETLVSFAISVLVE
jgi:C4-type Zn-finger protein